MKHLLLFFVAILLISSCTIQQDLYFNKDGSGKLRMTMDANSLIEIAKMSGKLGGDKNPSDTIKNSKKQKIQDFVLSNIDKMYLDFKLDVYDVLPDSIKDKIENPELLKDYSIIVYNNKDQSEIGMNVDFSSLESLDNKTGKILELLELLNYERKDNGKKKDLDMYSQGSKEILKSDYSKYIKFKKGKITILPKIEENNDEAKGEMGSLAKVRTRIHLPGKVKKSKDGKYSIHDRNTIELKDSGLEVINPGKTPIKIKYKRAWWDIF